MVFEVSAAAYIAEVPSYIPVVNHRFVRMVPQQQEKELWKLYGSVHALTRTHMDLQRIPSMQNFYQKGVTFKGCHFISSSYSSIKYL